MRILWVEQELVTQEEKLKSKKIDVETKIATL